MSRKDIIMKCANFQELLVKSEQMDNISGYTLMGYFRMYFRNGWFGRWFAKTDEFEENGARDIESAKIKDFCAFVEDNFTGGCDEKMVDYLKTNSNYQRLDNGTYYNAIEVDDKSYIVIQVSPQYGNSDYPIRVLLYRKV